MDWARNERCKIHHHYVIVFHGLPIITKRRLKNISSNEIAALVFMGMNCKEKKAPKWEIKGVIHGPVLEDCCCSNQKLIASPTTFGVVVPYSHSL